MDNRLYLKRYICYLRDDCETTVVDVINGLIPKVGMHQMQKSGYRVLFCFVTLKASSSGTFKFAVRFAASGVVGTAMLEYYLRGVLRRYKHCTGHITTGSWKGRLYSTLYLFMP